MDDEFRKIGNRVLGGIQRELHDGLLPPIGGVVEHPDHGIGGVADWYVENGAERVRVLFHSLPFAKRTKVFSVATAKWLEAWLQEVRNDGLTPEVVRNMNRAFKQHTVCQCCGRSLEDAFSQWVGLGTECYKKRG